MNQSGPANNPTDLPSLDVHPLLFRALVAVFLVGLAIDLWILVRFLYKRRAAESVWWWLHVNEKPWGLGEVGLVSGALFTMLCIASQLVAWLDKLAVLSSEHMELTRLLASALSLNVLGIVAIGWLVHLERSSLREAFGIAWNGLGRAVGRGIVYLTASLPLIWALMKVSGELCERLHVPIAPQDIARIFLDTHSAPMRWTIAVLAVVGAPVFEELFFRGFAYPALKQKIGFLPAAILVSLGFALIHFHVLSFLPLVALAMGLTLAYESSGNLIVPMVMHSLFNLMTIAQMLIVPS